MMTDRKESDNSDSALFAKKGALGSRKARSMSSAVCKHFHDLHSSISSAHFHHFLAVSGKTN
jgi:hypothetical protein